MDTKVIKIQKESSKESKGNRKRVSSFKYRESTSKSPEKPNIRRSGSIYLSDPTLSMNILIKTNGNRKDAYGTSICKGSKRHKVSFIDQIAQVKLVNYLDINHPISKNEAIQKLSISNYNSSKIIGMKKSKAELMREGKTSTQCTACIVL